MRALLPVVLVLLLGLLAFLFLGDRPEAPRDEGDGGTAVEADHPVAAEELDAGSAPAGEGLQREGDDGAPGSGRSADGGMRWGAPLVPGEDGLVLAVVDGDTGDAVPGAVIQLIPEGRNVRAGDPAVPDGWEDFAAYWLGEAESWKVDESGELAVPAPWRGRTVIARSETGFAVQSLWGADTKRFEIRLAPSRDCLVRVVDVAGLPVASVEVGLYREVYQNFHRQMSVVTDERGLARFHEILDPGLSRRGMDRWRFSVAPQLGQVRTEAVPRAELPSELTLRIADLAGLRIELQEDDGRPAARPLEVVLTTTAQREHHDAESGGRLGMLGASTPDGVIDLVGLPVGEALVLLCDFAWQASGGRRWQELTVPALASGERRTVVFRDSGSRPTLNFLVLDPQGEPLADTELWGEFQRKVRHISRLPDTPRLRTDADGRFRWTLDQGPMSTAAQELQERSFRIYHDLVDPPARWQATVDLSRDFDASPAEDLVVRLRDLPLTAGGWVRRPDGSRLANVTVELRGTPPVEVVDGVNHIMSERRLASTSTDEDGRFRLYAGDAAGFDRLQLEARGRSGEEATMLVRLGSDQHDLMLDPGGILVGKVKRPKSLPDLAVTTAFHYANPQHPDWDYWEMEGIDRQGAFRYAGMPDIEGTLKVALGGGYPGEVVIAIEGVRPWREGMNPDPRLQEIDLEGLVRGFEVVALDQAGEVMPEARFLQIQESGGGYSWRTLSSPEGRVSLYGGTEPIELRIQAEGHYDAVVELQEGLNEVRMDPAPTVVFRLDRMPDLPPHRSLRLDLDPVDGGGFFQLAESGIGADGVLETAAPPPGSYKVAIDVVTHTDGGWSSTSNPVKLPDGSPYVVVVGRGEGQRFEIIVPDGFYERVIR
ncbi:MAG: hypothetical protein ACYTF3_03980 [Planctomycetota bacterium]|jgi:hypothetical protein